MNPITFKGLFVKSLAETETSTSLWIKGFASMAGADRVSDNIDPRLFDLKTFMTNPQLWLDHGLVKKTLEDGTVIETNIGLVREACVAQVDLAADGKSFNVIDLESGNVIDTITDTNSFLVKDGQRGLWVKAEIMEESVAEEVNKGKINSFSWQGAINRRKSGTIKSIDLVEVSIVHIPMHPQAKFIVGKAMNGESITSAVVYDGGVVEERNVDETTCKKSQRPTDFLVIASGDNGEQRCFFESEESAKSGAVAMLTTSKNVLVLQSKHLDTPDGGHVYNFRFAASATENAALKPDEAQSIIVERKSDKLTSAEQMLLDNANTPQETTEPTTKGGELDMTKEELKEAMSEMMGVVKGMSEKIDALETIVKASEESPAVPETTTTPETPETTPETVSKEADDEAVGILTEMLTLVKDLSSRVSKIEGKPMKSQQVREEDDSDGPIDTASVLKSLRSASKDDINKMLAETFVADGVGRR